MANGWRLQDHWPWLLLLLGMPLAALGLLLSPNEYESMGGAGIDCDGPMLLGFAVPTAALYAVCAIAFVRRAWQRRSVSSAVAALVSAVLAVALSANSFAAWQELQRPDHRSICGSQDVHTDRFRAPDAIKIIAATA